MSELDELQNLLQIPLCTGTINRGSDVIGSGLIANDFAAFCGMDTTANEISVVDGILKLSESDQNKFSDELRGALIDTLF